MRLCWWVGSSTVTWQLYLPGKLAQGKLEAQWDSLELVGHGFGGRKRGGLEGFLVASIESDEG